MGKFLLAFTCFWAYIAYSQYMLTWVTNLPDAIPYLLHRQKHGWQYVFYALILGHFVFPFLILLQRSIKMRPAALATVGLWILFIHYVDLYAVVMPQVRPEKPLLDWANVTAFVGVGGVALVVGVLLMRGRPAVPVKDPFLADSLTYSKMM
jgi:predicted ferric reductase